MKTKYYLAYGSNLNICRMLARCPEARPVGTTEIEGYELRFNGSLTGAYLTIEKKPGGRVPAAVWATTAADEASLDRYEGCPAFYYKTEMKLPVRGLCGGRLRQLTVYMYIMHEERRAGIPGRRYVENCLKGYDDFGFQEEVLLEAVQKAWRLCHERKQS